MCLVRCRFVRYSPLGQDRFPGKQCLGFGLVPFPGFPLRASISAYLTPLPGADGASQVRDASLPTCQALRPRQTLGNLTVSIP